MVTNPTGIETPYHLLRLVLRSLPFLENHLSRDYPVIVADHLTAFNDRDELLRMLDLSLETCPDLGGGQNRRGGGWVYRRRIGQIERDHCVVPVTSRSDSVVET